MNYAPNARLLVLDYVTIRLHSMRDTSQNDKFNPTVTHSGVTWQRHARVYPADTAAHLAPDLRRLSPTLSRTGHPGLVHSSGIRQNTWAYPVPAPSEH